MQVEIIIYLFLSLVLSAMRRVISGMKNGCFYAKGNKYPVPLLIKYIKNLHFLETPAWYIQFGGLFFSTLAIFRAVNYTTDIWGIIVQLSAALLATMGSSCLASYWFQGYINHGSSLPWVDPKENPKSEFAFGPISFWWKRPWWGPRRKYLPYLGLIEIIIAILIGLNII